MNQMLSKWLDVGIEIGAFHMQSNQYNNIKPPSFGQYPQLKSVIRERERITKMSLAEMEQKLDEEASRKSTFLGSFLSFSKKKKKRVKMQSTPILSINSTFDSTQEDNNKKKIPLPRPRTNPEMAGFGGTLKSLGKLKSISRLDGGLEDDSPSLFLQEACHLLSLLASVTMSTLRNDIENAESPLTEYVPGEPWPPVDPDQLQRDIRKEYDQSSSLVTAALYIMGYTRTEKSRTLYNAARPFRVLGGVSDAEIQLLQSARGPYAKVALCTMWLQEFIAREHLAGSMGAIAPPIISRLFQYISDGMLGYNQARKIAYIPFPFPHAQLTSWFVFVLVLVLPVLNLCWGVYIAWAAILNFLTVICFAGLHEVARELEAPFQNTPNDLPLTTSQAQFNEALITMYAGYHPDAFWTASGERENVTSSSGFHNRLRLIEEEYTDVMGIEIENREP